MESQTEEEPDRATALRLLASAQDARQRGAAAVGFPRGYLPLMAIAGAALMLRAGLSTPEGDGTTASVLTLVVIGAGLGATWVLHVGNPEVRALNKVRGPVGAAAILSALPIWAAFLAVAVASTSAGSWWPGLVAAPFGAAGMVGIALGLLAIHRRTARVA